MKQPLAPIPDLRRILSSAYLPCSCFKAPCATMRFMPVAGHVPRGFTGAFGTRQDVELILVLAEPGDPASSAESYSPDAVRHVSFIGKLSRLVQTALAQRISPFHKNLRIILDGFWPGLTLEQQLRKTWITESVLCSAEQSGGKVSPAIERACGETYLKKQIRLFPSATLVALGGKANLRLQRCGIAPHIVAHAPGRPGGSKPAARKSWTEAASRFHQRIDSMGAPTRFITEKLASVPSGFPILPGDLMQRAEQVLSRWRSTEHCKRQASGTIHARLSGEISLYVNLRKTPEAHLLLHIRRAGANHVQWANQYATAIGGQVKNETAGHHACVELRVGGSSELGSVLDRLEVLAGA